MQTTLAGVKEKILAKLNAIEIDGVPAFKQVFDYDQGEFKKFPVAVLTHTGWRGTEIDTHRNERVFNFVIKLYQEQSEEGRTKEQANEIMTATTDAILIAFDQDKDLGGEVELIKVVEGDTTFLDRPGTYNYATFRVDCIVVVPNYA